MHATPLQFVPHGANEPNAAMAPTQHRMHKQQIRAASQTVPRMQSERDEH
jgi:hypothetical protein